MSKRSRRRRNPANLGFTLIELMVVIAIIGILATIVVPNLLGAADEANVKAAQAQIQSFRTAITQFRLSNNRFPNNLEELINNEDGRRYLDANEIPDDPWGNPYQYTEPGPDGHQFEVKSLGANGQPGGDGYDAEIVSWDLQ